MKKTMSENDFQSFVIGISTLIIISIAGLAFGLYKVDQDLKASIASNSVSSDDVANKVVQQLNEQQAKQDCLNNISSSGKLTYDQAVQAEKNCD